jgi:hypothetical protein
MCFTHMLQVYVLMFHPFHTDVAFKCFMLFGWLRDTRSDGGTAQVLGNDGRGDLGAADRARRSGRDVRGVRVRDGVNGFESRRTRRAARAR